MTIAEFPRGNAFPFTMNLKIKDGDGNENPVSNLASAVDVVVYVGADPATPDLILSLGTTPAKVSIDDPETGSVTFSVESTDSINMALGKHKASIQVKYAADDSNNVEWLPVEVFKLAQNKVPPASS